jgi:hypothetical protein
MAIIMKIPQRQPETKEERIAAWRENIPNFYNGAYRKQYDKAMSGESLRAAANDKCLDCKGYKRSEVKNCDLYECSLHPYRPYQAGLGRPVSFNPAQHRASGAVDTKKNDEISTMVGVSQ